MGWCSLNQLYHKIIIWGCIAISSLHRPFFPLEFSWDTNLNRDLNLFAAMLMSHTHTHIHTYTYTSTSFSCRFEHNLALPNLILLIEDRPLKQVCTETWMRWNFIECSLPPVIFSRWDWLVQESVLNPIFLLRWTGPRRLPIILEWSSTRM